MMDNTFAVDILDRTPSLALADYSYVRVYCGKEWVNLEIRDGIPTIRGSRAFLVRLSSANQIGIEFDK